MANKKTSNDGFVSTEDWLPIIEIKNGMIEVKGTPLTGHQFVTGVRIEPKNIFISEQQVQMNTIYNLRDLYNNMDFEFWLVCCDRPVDINLYKSELEIMYSQEENANIRKLINDDINKCDKFIGPEVNAVDTVYYILIKDSIKNRDLLIKRIQIIISDLAKSGLNSRQVTDDDLRVVLDSFFNDTLKMEYGTVMTNV